MEVTLSNRPDPDRMDPVLELWLDSTSQPVLLRCAGRLESSTVGPFKRAVAELLRCSRKTMVLDIGSLQIADEEARGSLVAAECSARQAGITLMWCGVPATDLRRLLQNRGVTVLVAPLQTSRIVANSVSRYAVSRVGANRDDLGWRSLEGSFARGWAS